MSGLSANIQNGARLDIAADGFGGSRFKRAFFDVKLNMPLSLHLFSLALVALGLKPQQAISIWPLCSMLNGTRHIA